MPTHFGTDGVRGVANAELTAELALALGRAVARVLPSPTFLAGRDTRRSGALIQAAFAAGISSEGGDVIDLGVLPTPGIAFLAARRGAPAAVISASHNPFADNGIKIIGPDGKKLSETVELEIEAALEAIEADPNSAPRRPTGHGVGRITVDPDAISDYEDHLVASLDGRTLDGLRIGLDCANGAAFDVAPDVFVRAGATVVAIATEPDGANINDKVGSTAPEQMAARVVEDGLDFGLCFDGDADRLIAVDGQGQVIDGDVVMALFAGDLKARGKLAGDTVVVTVMSNLGFHHAMSALGITVTETDVGDRHVIAAIDAGGLSFGGEQSGHMIFRNRATTGDGVLTGLLLADLVARHGRKLEDLAAEAMHKVPQILVNVPMEAPKRIAELTSVWEVVGALNGDLGGSGRILVRPSGTEALVRIMVEADDEAVARNCVDQIRAAILAAV